MAALATVLAAVVGGWLWIEFDGGDLFETAKRALADVVDRTPAEPDGAVDPAAGAPVAEGPGSTATGGGALLVARSEPPGAEVLVGETVVGETPLERSDIRAGRHRITVRHARYREEVLDREFADGVVTDVDVTLRPATGRLTVVTEPRNAWIERDGVRLAEGTPVTLENLPVGSVSLRLGADDHRNVDVRADVPSDGVGRLQRSLERITYGTLTLDLVPPDATVTLPNIGPVYHAGMRLPDGAYRVVVRRDGYRDLTRTIDVLGDTRERMELALIRLPFTVSATPRSATVQLIGATGRYSAGMLLPPDEYRVRVTARGHQPYEGTVSHRPESTNHAVALLRLDPAALHPRDYVRWRMEGLQGEMSDEGYEAVYDIEFGALDDDEKTSFRFPLVGGSDYRLVAVCDANCADVDLLMYDGQGIEVARDVPGERTGFVNLSPARSDAFRAEIWMYACRSGPCHIGFGVFGARIGSPLGDAPTTD